MKLQAWSGEPQVVEFKYLVDSRGKTPAITHEVRVMRIYEPIGFKTGVILCTCPRTVRPDQRVVVWHDPECPEIDRDA